MTFVIDDLSNLFGLLVDLLEMLGKLGDFSEMYDLFWSSKK